MRGRSLLNVGVFCLLGFVVLVRCEELIENETGDGYGTEWLYFYAEDGTTHVMNFSTIPSNTRGMFFGDATFKLFTRNNVDAPEELIIPEDDSEIQSKYFNPSDDIKIVTHGWMSSDSTQWLQNIRDAYLRKYDYNVITADWSDLAHNPSYVWPALSTRFIGKRVAELISSLNQTYDITNRNIHLIGHSLGAQVMGYAGQFSEGKIHRITGLDPARPLFELPLMSSEFRLERSDAAFVDIIHTCRGVYGYRNSHGHADFYPNNGKPRQPGCEGLQTMIEGCSHGKSCEFFGESIDTDDDLPFVAYPCDSWEEFNKGGCKENATDMGDPASPNSRGDYYLRTSNESRYAMGDEQNE